MKPELATRHGSDAESRRQTEAATPGPASPAPRPIASAGHRLRFVGAAALFAAWLGWLAYLAVTTRTPVVLSRPQFLVSAVDVVVTIGSGTEQVPVKQVLWSATDEGRKLAGTTITITNLDRCVGLKEPGDYIVPLIPDGPHRYQVPATPRSPGFEPNPSTEAGRPRIYPATPETLKQVATMPKP